MVDEPTVVSAQAWECPCGRVNGIPEVPACGCGEYTVDGPVKKAGRVAEAKPEAKVEKPSEPEPDGK